MYNEKINQSFKKIDLSIKNKLSLLNLNLINVGNLVYFPDNILKIKKILID